MSDEKIPPVPVYYSTSKPAAPARVGGELLMALVWDQVAAELLGSLPGEAVLEGMPAESDDEIRADRLLSVAEAAELLNLSVATIYGLCSRRKLRHERHGLGRGTIRIPKEAVEAYRRGVTVRVAEGAVPQPPPPKLKLKHLQL